MKIYVINLKKNTDRLAHMSEQLAEFGLSFERIDAVYGKMLSADERKIHFAAFHSRLAAGQMLREGEIGCALSQQKAYRRLLASGESHALVLEDDINIVPPFDVVLEHIESTLDFSRPVVALLSAHGCEPSGEGDGPRCEPIMGAMCADAYVISRSAAEIILKVNYPVVTVADKWGRWVSRYGIAMYRVWPTTVKQDNERFGTDIALVKYKTPKGLGWVWRKMHRVPEVFCDWLWFKITGR